MNKIKVIKTENDYEEALKLIESLISRDPEPDSEEGEKLSLLSALVEDYESKNFPSTIPNPVDAIKFRMEQGGFKPADLIPYIGSRSRVSEILSGKRQLTLEMVRALEAGLGIPAKVLIRKTEQEGDILYSNWSPLLLKEMEARGYFGSASIKKIDSAELLTNFFSIIGNQRQLVGMLRKTSYRSSPLTDKRALTAWSVRVVQKAKKIKTPVKYKHGIIDLAFMRKLARLSTQENGPIRAQEFLKENGIILVIEPHFLKTYLDGAVILLNKENPVIGLTLRHDRLDNFWFTLMHELAHISLHFNEGIGLFFDEIEDIKTVKIDEREIEADEFAEEALLPKAKWEVSPARIIPSAMAAKSLAKELGVHVAIIAGQIRHKGNKYIYLSKMVNEAKVRIFFPKEKWNK